MQDVVLDMAKQYSGQQVLDMAKQYSGQQVLDMAKAMVRDLMHEVYAFVPFNAKYHLAEDIWQYALANVGKENAVEFVAEQAAEKAALIAARKRAENWLELVAEGAYDRVNDCYSNPLTAHMLDYMQEVCDVLGMAAGQENVPDPHWQGYVEFVKEGVIE